MGSCLSGGQLCLKFWYERMFRSVVAIFLFGLFCFSKMSFENLPTLPQLIELDSSDDTVVIEESASFDLGPQWSEVLADNGDGEECELEVNFLPGNEYGFSFFYGCLLSSGRNLSLLLKAGSDSVCASGALTSTQCSGKAGSDSVCASGALTSTQCSGNLPVVFTGLMEGACDSHAEDSVEKSELMSTMNAEDVANKTFHEDTWNEIPCSQPVSILLISGSECQLCGCLRLQE